MSKAKSGFGFFSFRVFVSKIWVWVFSFFLAKFVRFFWCFVAGIFRFANFIYGFAKFLGFVLFFVQISLLDLGIHLDGKKIAKKML